MKPITRCLTIISFLGMAGGSSWAQEKADLSTTLRKLEKDIAAVRGLEFKTPVVAKVIPRPKGAAKGVQGFYNIKDKALFLYDDISGAYERGVLIHEMVHALQDQHFGLRKLHSATFDGDADLARSALIEGDATFTMIELLKEEQPRVAAMLDAPLARSKNIQNAFLYAQGARYVKALKERGGWAAVNTAYRFPPASTAAVLHPEGVASIDLGFGRTRGELAIVQTLAAHDKTADLAMSAAAGWKGDRFIDQGDLKAWQLAFATDKDANEFQAAMVKLRVSQKPDLKPVLEVPGKAVWRDDKNAIRAVLSRNERVLVLDAPDEATYQSLLEHFEGPLPLVIYSTQEKRTITFGQLTDRLLAADLICVGESHDNDLHHRVQLEVIKALSARDDRLGVGMEMFQRPFQKDIDRYFRGELDEAAFLTASEYRKRWGFDWSLYRPIVEFCRKNSLPVAALNAPRELTRRITEVGFEGLKEEEKKELGAIDLHLKEHREYWLERLGKLHGKAKVSDEQKERSYQVMATWDDYMAASAALFQKERGLRRLVVLAGSGHIDRGFGIPLRAAKRTGGKAVTVHIDTRRPGDLPVPEPVADFMIIVKTLDTLNLARTEP